MNGPVTFRLVDAHRRAAEIIYLRRIPEVARQLDADRKAAPSNVVALRAPRTGSAA